MQRELEKIVSIMNIQELVTTRNEIQDLITTQQKEEKNRLLESFIEQASQAGLNFSDIISDLPTQATTSDKPRKPAKPKYKNPADNSQTWTGRGRKPLWVVEFLASNDWQESNKDVDSQDELIANKQAMIETLEAVLIEQA